MKILTEEIKEFVKRQKLSFVATVCADGTPNLSPKGTTIVWNDDHLAFADIHSPGTITNLRINSSIEMNMVDVFLRKGYRFKGTASIISEGPDFEKAMEFYNSGERRYPIKNIVLVKVEQVLPLFSPIYDTGATEEEVKEMYIRYWSSFYPVK